MEVLLIDESGAEVPRARSGRSLSGAATWLAVLATKRTDENGVPPCPTDPDQRIFGPAIWADVAGRLSGAFGTQGFPGEIMGQWVTIPIIEAALSGLTGSEMPLWQPTRMDPVGRLTATWCLGHSGATVGAISRHLQRSFPYMIPQHTSCSSHSTRFQCKIDRRSLPLPRIVLRFLTRRTSRRETRPSSKSLPYGVKCLKCRRSEFMTTSRTRRNSYKPW